MNIDCICDNGKCTSVATREVHAEGFTVVKRICDANGCMFWVRAWFDVLYPVRGGHSLSVAPIGSEAAA